MENKRHIHVSLFVIKEILWCNNLDVHDVNIIRLHLTGLVHHVNKSSKLVGLMYSASAEYTKPTCTADGKQNFAGFAVSLPSLTHSANNASSFMLNPGVGYNYFNKVGGMIKCQSKLTSAPNSIT
jgi:hypothetical protein